MNTYQLDNFFTNTCWAIIEMIMCLGG